MIIPINGHLLIEPIVKKDFIPDANEKYQEIGVVVDIDKRLSGWEDLKGKRVYFDAWLAKKYPNGSDGFYWLVNMGDIVAYEEISE